MHVFYLSIQGYKSFSSSQQIPIGSAAVYNFRE